MKVATEIIDWLLSGDVSIRWQTHRDLLAGPPEMIQTERAQVATQGWGARLLSYQDTTGIWGGGLYTPKWVSTTYTMLLLRQLGLEPGHVQAQKACSLLLNHGLYRDGGINFFASLKHSEVCVTGMVLSILAYFEYPDNRIEKLVNFLVKHQMRDGGWNCQIFNGASHSSFHTTINVLEGLWLYERCRPSQYDFLAEIQERGREFLLQHQLYRSHRTGTIVDPKMTRFSFPPHWRYDVLRALDYFQACAAPLDARLVDAIELVHKRRTSTGRWLLQNRHPGKMFFDLEQAGQPSHWNTLRALRVIRWWHQG